MIAWRIKPLGVHYSLYARRSMIAWGISRASRWIAGQVTGWARRSAWNRGVRGGSSFWFVVFCVTAAVQVVRKTLRKHGRVTVYSERLPAGSAIAIRHLHPGRD